jgi:Fe-S-cluster containining protein
MGEMTQNQRYKLFIYALTKEFEKMFESQSEYICCKVGCSHCCEKGVFPFSRLEFECLKEGYDTLSDEIKDVIKTRIKNLENTQSDDNMYSCPFLIDKKCAVYNHRGIVCRTFGLLLEHEDKRLTIPFCHTQGLNYSNIYDYEKGCIVENNDGGIEPKAYRVSRDSMMKISLAKQLELDFGESKTVLDWLIEANL